jgi:hypothetical protein
VKVVSSVHFSSSRTAWTQSPFTESQANDQTEIDDRSDLSLSLRFVSFEALWESQTLASGRIFPSISFAPSFEVISSIGVRFSLLLWTQHRCTVSQVIRETDNLLSQNSIETRFLLLSLSIVETSWLVSMKQHETAPIPVSHTDIPSDLRISSAVFLSHELNLERWSPQRSSSNGMERSLFALESRGIEITAMSLSNPLLTTRSDFPSILFPTAGFLTPIDDQLKISRESDKITSIAASGGALIGLITIICLYFILVRRRNRSQTEEAISEFDLPDEHSEEEEFDAEDENDFELEDDAYQTNSNALSESETENWVRGRIRGGDHLRMDFDGEESICCPEHIM